VVEATVRADARNARRRIDSDLAGSIKRVKKLVLTPEFDTLF
jgi:hypothetical protein